MMIMQQHTLPAGADYVLLTMLAAPAGSSLNLLHTQPIATAADRTRTKPKQPL